VSEWTCPEEWPSVLECVGSPAVVVMTKSSLEVVALESVEARGLG
jgi:hypothetical protein